MNLLGLIEVAGEASDLLKRARGALSSTQPDWVHDEEAFFRHFGVPPEEYECVVQHMSDDQLALLRDTLAVNPEAAVLWVLSMEEIGDGG